MAPFVPIRRARTYEDVLTQIQQAIDRGEYTPGDRLPAERELATAMGVNRAAVRQALHTLSVLRIIDIRHGEGTFVRPYQTEGSLEALLLRHLFTGEQAALLPDLMQIRRFIEIPIAGLAAERRTEEQIGEMNSLIHQQENALERPDEFFYLDQQFHLLLSTMAQNRLIPLIINTLGLLLKQMFGQYAGLMEGRLRRSWEQHRRIASAIENRDAEDAKRVMAEHLGDVTSQLESMP